MDYWNWLISGLVLLIIELFLPADFFLFFIGIAALLTGVFTWAHLLPATIELQVICFALLAPTLLYTIRKPLYKKLIANSKKLSGKLENSQVKILQDIAPNQSGKGSCRGTSWTVVNKTDMTLTSGSKHKIAEVDGLSIIVK